MVSILLSISIILIVQLSKDMRPCFVEQYYQTQKPQGSSIRFWTALISRSPCTISHQNFLFTCSSFLQCLRFWHDTDPISVSFIFSEPLERAKEPDQLAIRSLSATKHGNVTSENASHDEIQGSCQQLIDDINAKRKRDTDLLNGRVKILNILILCLINDYTVLICHGCFAIFLI